MNWYQQEKAEKLVKEAGIKEGVTAALLFALLSIFSGSTIYNAAKRYNLQEEEVAEALQDDELIQRVKEMSQKMIPQEQPIINPVQRSMPYSKNENQKTVSNISADELIKHIISHEGLIPKQTPFRYTSDEMRKWNTIHGFEIDKTSPRPSNRKNFVFLKNQDDIPKAVKQQFRNYSKNPEKYEGLSNNPTLEEAIRVFDQTGANGKIQYLQETFPSLNIHDPLSKYF